MAALRQLRRQSFNMSVSLPDVSCATSRLNSSSQDFVPMPPLASSPVETAAANYNIDDDRWADKIDPSTGSVIFIDPRSRDSHSHLDGYARPRSSSSCSSLSSITSFPDLPPASSPLLSLRSSVRSDNLPERFSRSLQFSPESPSPVPENSLPEVGFHVPQTAVLPPKKTSSLKKIKKVLKRKRSSSRTGSLSDLNEIAVESHVQSLPIFSEGDSTAPSTPTSVVPETTLYGSQGLPLHTSNYSPASIRSHRSSTMVRVNLDISQFGLGFGRTPCSLNTLGIVPSRSLSRGKFGSTFSLRHSKGSYPSAPEISQPVIVRGVVPGSPAAVTQQIYSGDTIYCVDGHSVNLDNIDDVLTKLSNKVQFVLKKGPYRQQSGLSEFFAHRPSPGGLVRLVSGGKDVVRTHSQHSHQHSRLLLYLTLDTEEDDPSGKDILYQWPRVDSEDQSAMEYLVQVRGLFLTLSDLLGEITCSQSFCSAITVEGSLFHLGYIKYGKELLLLALPENLTTPYQVKLLVEKISYTLELLYGSVHNAFTVRHTSSLDHLLALFFDSISSPDPSSSVQLDSSLPVLTVIPQLKLPADVKVRLSAALSGLDSADHNNRPEILHIRRPFVLVGTCLFLKGALASSHLSDSDQRDVAQLCNAFRLPELTSTEGVSQIVIWKQVFLSRFRNPNHTPDSAKSSKQYYIEEKHFVLIVGLEYVFICMLMEPTCPFESHSPPGVDAVYVDRARSLIMELKAQDLLAECEEKGLPSTSLPSLTSVDIALASKFTRRASVSLASLPPTNPYPRKSSVPTVLSTPASSRSKPSFRMPDSSDSDDIGTEWPDSKTKNLPESRPRAQSLLTASSKSKKKGSTLQVQKGPESLVLKGAPRLPYTLTSGLGNILFHYIHLFPGRGVMLCPTHPTPPGPVQSELIRTFRETCLSIREVLYGGVGEVACGVESESDSDSEGWDSDEEQIQNVKEPVSPFAPHASSVVEHGMLLQCGIYSAEKQKNTPTLNYWVVGRLFEGETELYVCFQENTSQDCVEMAYRLLFGWTG